MKRTAFPFPTLSRALFSTVALLSLSTGLLYAPAFAQAPATTPLHLIVTKPLTPVTDVLASLSQQSGIPILADDTVVDTLGVATIDKPSLPEMLDTITSLVPAITWQRVDLPGDAPLPDANTLSTQVRSLKALPGTLLSVTEPGAKTSVTFARTPMDLSQFPAGAIKTVYLLTNETVRAQRLANKQAADAKKQAQNPLNQTVGGLQNVASAFGQLTPDQQRTALPQMMQQFQQIMRSIDPSVIQDLRQNAAQNGGNPFGGNNGGPRGQ